MLAANIPTKFPEIFAGGAGAGYIRVVPVPSQIGITDGAASFTDGFPPLTATPIESGGVPPDIKDMNGLLFEISAWSQWQQAGGPVFYDGDFSTAIGGYPQGAVLMSSVTPGLLFYSSADSNTTNPDSGGSADWVSLAPVPATLSDLITGTNTVKYVNAATLAGLRASSAQILAGVDTARYMTPAAFFASRASSADIIAGTDDHKYLTPYGLATAGIGPMSGVENAGGFGGGFWAQFDVLGIGSPIIVQTGSAFSASGSGNAGVTITFPEPFPTKCYNVVGVPGFGAGYWGGDDNVQFGEELSSRTLTGTKFRYSTGLTGINYINWVAFGR